MHIVESLSLGINNKIHLIKVNKQFFIISSTNKNIEFLTHVDINDFEEEEIKNPISGVADFTSVLKKYLNGVHLGKQQPKNEAAIKQMNSSETQHFIFKNNLEKLKNMNKGIDSQRSENGQDKEI